VETESYMHWRWMFSLDSLLDDPMLWPKPTSWMAGSSQVPLPLAVPTSMKAGSSPTVPFLYMLSNEKRFPNFMGCGFAKTFLAVGFPTSWKAESSL
jgi:hypothetical protein